jgi:minor extracellular serine protease Vpr
VAVGSVVYTAAEETYRDGAIYSSSGFAVLQGTSFSSPIVAGAAALLKQARPGLTAGDYRSLLINSTAPFTVENGEQAPVAWTGAGLLNVAAAMAGTVSAYPVSLSFGAGGSTADLSRSLLISNVGSAGDWFDISVAQSGSGPAPTISEAGVWLEPGASKALTLQFQGVGLEPAAYQGSVEIHPSASGVTARVPYWYGVSSGLPAYLTVLYSAESGRPARTLEGAIYFRITDSNGIPITNIEPKISVVSGGGAVVAVRMIDSELPGSFAADLRLGRMPGTNTFEISVEGSLVKTVQISGAWSMP